MRGVGLSTEVPWALHAFEPTNGLTDRISYHLESILKFLSLESCAFDQISQLFPQALFACKKGFLATLA